MVTTLEQLFRKHHATFHLTLEAGKLNGQNIVDWIYMLEDETILPYVQGGSLIVTTGARTQRNSDWLKDLVLRLIEIRTSGLIVNTGKYIHTIPDEVIDICREHNFPLITMPWEIRITDMTQTLCMTIIDNQQEILLHDKAIRDAILTPEDEDEYRDCLARYYDLKGDFTILTVDVRDRMNSSDEIFTPSKDTAFRLEHRIRLLRQPTNKDLHICWVQMERYQIFMINRMDREETLTNLAEIIRDVYSQLRSSHRVYIGIGTTEIGIHNLCESFRCSLSALRLAREQNTPLIRFRDMGFQQILLSCRSDAIPQRYADQLLAPIDALGSKSQDYLTLLDAYIRNDRSPERTAEELFLHRNTVNYRLKKLREILDAPLKTTEDLLPYLLALYIRDPGRKKG